MPNAFLLAGVTNWEKLGTKAQTVRNTSALTDNKIE